MAQLTIEVPDELAQRLELVKDSLPELLGQVLEIANLPTPEVRKNKSEPVDIYPVYQEVIDFLIKQPAPEEIINFKVSHEAQLRLENLLEKNRSAIILPLELAELDMYEQLDYMMVLLKSRAYAEFNK